MKCLVTADSNWAIGKAGGLLVSIPSDRKMMHNETAGKVIVMGRNSLKNYPNSLPLAGRTNVILSHNSEFSVRGGIVAHDDDELAEILSQYDSDDIYFVGGESVYEKYLPYCDTVIVTKIDQIYDADAYFPNLDCDENWQLVAESDEQTYFSVEYTFREYRNEHPYMLARGVRLC